MTREEVIRHYPGCPDAVILHEGELMEGMWEPILGSKRSPDEVLSRLLKCADETLKAFPKGSMARAFQQMSHPDFKKYLNAKLGGM